MVYHREERHCSDYVHAPQAEVAVVIYLFRDEADDENFAFSVEVTGANIPSVTAQTEWFFLESIDTLRFPEPWDMSDFQNVLDHLKANGYYLKGELIAQAPKSKRPRSPFEC